MGQQGSKSSVEARVLFHRIGAADTYQRIDARSTPPSAVHIQRKVTNHSSARAVDRSTSHPWPQSRCDTGGLVYVMDNPTGGVWVKPGQKWTRS